MSVNLPGEFFKLSTRFFWGKKKKKSHPCCVANLRKCDVTQTNFEPVNVPVQKLPVPLWVFSVFTCFYASSFFFFTF